MRVFLSLACLLLFIIIATSDVSAQVPVPPLNDTVQTDSAHVDSSAIKLNKEDTILFVPPTFEGELPVTDSSNLEKRLRQSPTGALFKSLVIPGWGQMSNGKPVKALIYAGLQGWCIGAAIHYGGTASNFKDSYEASTEVSIRREYYAMYKDRRQERNKYLFFLGLTTLVSVFDAFVDAHLTGSPAHPEKAVGFELQPAPGGMQASLALRF